jgi:hypothetical protein
MGCRNLTGKLAYAYHAEEYVLVLEKIHGCYYKVFMKNKIAIIPTKNLILNINNKK